MRGYNNKTVHLPKSTESTKLILQDRLEEAELYQIVNAKSLLNPNECFLWGYMYSLVYRTPLDTQNNY